MPYTVYRDTPIAKLVQDGIIDRNTGRACQSATPPLVTAGHVVRYLEEHGTLADIPGCRRPGRITSQLHALVSITVMEDTPQAPVRPAQATEPDLGFAPAATRTMAQRYKEEHGHWPMFALLADYLCGPDATRSDRVLALWLGLEQAPGVERDNLASIAAAVDLTRERVRQIIAAFSIPEHLLPFRLWKAYADHSTYYVDERSPRYTAITENEVPGLPFAAYMEIMKKVSSLVAGDGPYLVRQGWEKEIAAWVKRLERLAAMPHSIDCRLSLSGLTMGGALDARLNPVVLTQIAPSMGIRPEAPDTIIVPRNLDN